MTPAFAGTLVLLGFAGAFVSGLVGVGGAIVMIPLLYYAPPLLGVGSLPMPEVSGVTMVQVLAAAAVGAWIHGRHAAVQRELAVTGGAAMAAASLAGALASSQLSARALLIVFTLMATVALPLLAVRPLEASVSAPSPEVSVPRGLAVGALALIGFASGLVGAGGAFLTVPVMIALLRLPMRLAIGTSLAVTGMSALAGVLGKALTAQIPLGPAAAVVLGSVVGARVGARVSRRVPVRVLRLVLVVLVALVAIRVWWDVLAT
ncbi:MAG TPA: sulfite exporter TauE/SafE family protein [Candidatus Nitrosocosmicus sp.]|nr:sulfite exporter TauE/SafE family protein [Candidatus Nitrosocosmicus sp.]